jgi:hypothetical protein
MSHAQRLPAASSKQHGDATGATMLWYTLPGSLRPSAVADLGMLERTLVHRGKAMDGQHIGAEAETWALASDGPSLSGADVVSIRTTAANSLTMFNRSGFADQRCSDCGGLVRLAKITPQNGAFPKLMTFRCDDCHKVKTIEAGFGNAEKGGRGNSA